MRYLLKKYLPESAYKFIRGLAIKKINRKYFEQDLVKIKCGNYEIEVPEKHSLINLLKVQPYRDLYIGIAAKYISQKYPNKSILDIGANIGDTAAIIATYAANKLILVEASDYFFEILNHNILQFPNEIVTQKVLVADGREITGSLHHWGGTANFYEGLEGDRGRKTERLCDIADQDTCFIKTDTDGFDFQILLSSLEWLASACPGILFENQIRNGKDLNKANELYKQLIQIGYKHFIVWDDPGFHLVSTNSLNILTDLNRYLFKIWQQDGHKSIFNYDVLCLHEQDEDVYREISEWYKAH